MSSIAKLFPKSIPDKKEIPDRLLQIVEPGDVVVTMGAGDIWKFGEEFINKLKSNS